MHLKFSDIKIDIKLIIGFGLVGLLLFMGTLVGVGASWVFKNRIDGFYQNYLLPEQQMRMMVESVYRIQSAFEGSLTGRLTLLQAQDIITREKFDVGSLLAGISEGDSNHNHAEQVSETWIAYQEVLEQTVIDLKEGDREALLTKLNNGVYASAQLELMKAVVEWRQEQSKIEGEYIADSESQFGVIAPILIGSGLFGILISQIVGFYVSRSITRPIRNLGIQMESLSSGKPIDPFLLVTDTKRKDELGDLARRLSEVDEYILSISTLADKVASGDLTVNIRPRCPEDNLSFALTRMINQLADLVHQINGSSRHVGVASQQLVSAATQTNTATAQITTTIQQVAVGLNRQSEDINQAMGAMDRTTQAVDHVAQGASEQENAVNKTIQEADQMAVAIGQVTANAKSVVKAAQLSSQKANEGAGTLKQTVSSMEMIRTQVAELAQKMNAVNTRSEEIGSIIETIEEIATKTNILAINATIEAAHAEVQAKKLTNDTLDQMMVSQCHFINQMLLNGGASKDSEYWMRLCGLAGLDTILATDEDGVTVLTNDVKLIGLRFSDDPKEQTYPFRKLIGQKGGVFCQEAQARSFDGQVFKYVGISRLDKPGIVQVGFNMNTVKKFDLRINGFAVVASEVYQLAERARESAREIRELVKGIQISIGEAVIAMQHSRSEVEKGMARAGSAGTALNDILESVQGVSLQANQALDAAGIMEQLSRSLEEEIRTFHRVMEGNNSAVTNLNEGYGTIAHIMESTASLSEENSAAAQEVSASAAEMHSQIENVAASAEVLARMSVELNAVIAHFKLNGANLSVGSKQVVGVN